MTVSRRRFVSHCAAAGAAAMLTDAASPVLPPANAGRRIDIHHHDLSPRFIAEAGSHRKFPPSSRDWTPARTLEDMDRAGVATAILSVPTPGVFFGDLAATRRLARYCNEYAAAMVRDYPGRFGLFAVLPLPDIDASLREIEHALDVLGADGIGMYSSYGKHWLGDPFLAPILQELNRRKTVLFVHPILNACCADLVPDVADTIVEYSTDTTRAIASFVFSGAAAQYPNLRVVFSHAGGTMPYLVERFTQYAKTKEIAARLPHGVLYELTRFSYDTAWSTDPAAMAALMKIVPTSQIVFGTDYPALPAAFQVAGLRACRLTEPELRAIYRTNALGLLPRLNAASA